MGGLTQVLAVAEDVKISGLQSLGMLVREISVTIASLSRNRHRVN